ncbi:unnamed protein product [Caenorhabditis auriculariae]|uniref:CID domain-containing protein n=1 Tax=Caenorhabditis auriculariae TaxID=2777116 RepID=A0A8S1HCI6_9PELO|nr:unnamed protein product [Caenorhabditis auriculariae]
MVILSQDVVLRRLQDIQNPTQEAIETMSLWIMHYKDKASIDVIVEGWLNAFKIASTDQQRIALFYVMNDVVQRAKSKHVDTLIPAFQPAVLTVVGIGKKYDSVKVVMRKCINIFGDRHVFTTASVTAMKNLLDVEDTLEAEENALDIDSDEIQRKIEDFMQERDLINDMSRTLEDSDFNYREKIRTHMKDRSVGAAVLEEVREAISAVVNVRHAMEAHKKRMIELIETAELAKRVYGHQLREVTIVEDAYQKFGQGVKEVRSEVMEMERTGSYPGMTPPRDAPSPTANDDIYATGVEVVLQNLRAPTSRDNREETDMEIGDDEEDSAATTSFQKFGNIQNAASSARLQFQAPPSIPQQSLQSRIAELGLMKPKNKDEVSATSSAASITNNNPNITSPPALPGVGLVTGARIMAPPPMSFTMPPPAMGDFSVPPPGFPPPLQFLAAPPVPPTVMPESKPAAETRPYPEQHIPPATINLPPPVSIPPSQQANIQALLKNLPLRPPMSAPHDDGFHMQPPPRLPSFEPPRAHVPTRELRPSDNQTEAYTAMPDYVTNPSGMGLPPKQPFMPQPSMYGNPNTSSALPTDSDDRVRPPSNGYNPPQASQYPMESNDSYNSSAEDQQGYGRNYNRNYQNDFPPKTRGYENRHRSDSYSNQYQQRDGGFRGNRGQGWNSDQNQRGFRGGRSFRGGRWPPGGQRGRF